MSFVALYKFIDLCNSLLTSEVGTLGTYGQSIRNYPAKTLLYKGKVISLSITGKILSLTDSRIASSYNISYAQATYYTNRVRSPNINKGYVLLEDYQHHSCVTGQ